jgi:hypothetical protein
MVLPYILALAAVAQATPAAQPPQVPLPTPPATHQPRQPAVQPGATQSRQPYYVLARDLLRRCGQGSAGVDYCFAYVTSVYDTVRSYELWLGLKEMCVPAGTVQSELVNTVLDHIRRHPEELDSLAASTAVVALQQRYACPSAAAQPAQPAQPPAR